MFLTRTALDGCPEVLGTVDTTYAHMQDEGGAVELCQCAERCLTASAQSREQGALVLHFEGGWISVLR